MLEVPGLKVRNFYVRNVVDALVPLMYNYQNKSTMHFDNAHTFAERFDTDVTRFDYTFILRVLKTRLEEWLHKELDDETFIGILEAAHAANGSGPLPWGPMLGVPRAFSRYYESRGYETKTSQEKGHRVSGFFFDSTGIFKHSRPRVRIFDHLILHIPHSGRQFIGERAAYAAQLERNARDLIDYFTDELFIPSEENEAIFPVVFPYCRTECDVERMIDDPLEAQDLGICYDSRILGKDHGFFYVKEKSFVRLEEDAYDLYLAHHYKVESMLVKHRDTLLIDCHSFSSHPTPLQPDYDTSNQYDICIGFNEDKTKPDEMIIGTFIDHFQSFGYRVGVNTPYSNAKTFNVPCSYKSIMVEVNKRCYMDESTYTQSADMQRMHDCIEQLYPKLLK